MRYLFVHQYFPGQFKFLAPALARMGHSVVAMTQGDAQVSTWRGIKIVRYKSRHRSTTGIHPWVGNFESKVIRGEACFRAALDLKAGGFSPDVIVAHPGWGESLFVKDVWPKAKLVIYCEFYYAAHGLDVDFDSEFPITDPGEFSKVKLENLNNLLHFGSADAGLSPTKFQADTFPSPFRERITIAHEGIDTTAVAPNPGAVLRLPHSQGDLVLTAQSEVVTFANRNLEPLRGFHIFMRSVPEILKRRKEVRVVIVGDTRPGYGRQPPAGKTWREVYSEEVRSQIAPGDWGRVHFVGKLDHSSFVRLLQISTVHVYLTYPFVLGWSLLEAMSAGCAIVASDTPPVLEAIQHDKTGRLVNFFDVVALSEEVERLIGDERRRIRLRSNARRFAIDRFDAKSVCLPRQLSWIDRLSGP